MYGSVGGPVVVVVGIVFGIWGCFSGAAAFAFLVKAGLDASSADRFFPLEGGGAIVQGRTEKEEWVELGKGGLGGVEVKKGLGRCELIQIVVPQRLDPRVTSLWASPGRI